MQIVIDIPEEMYKWVNDVNKFFYEYGTSDFVDLVKNGTPLPKNVTNGDILKILFPNYESRYDAEYEVITGHLDKTHRHNFNLDWWDAPYKKGGEE